MEPVTQIRALTGNQTGNLSMHTTMLNQVDIPRERQSDPFKVHSSALVWHVKSSRIWAWPLLQTCLIPPNLKFYVPILLNSITFVNVVPITWKTLSSFIWLTLLFLEVTLGINYFYWESLSVPPRWIKRTDCFQNSWIVYVPLNQSHGVVFVW